MEIAEAFEQIVHARRSNRVYASDFDYNPEIVQKSLALAILAPNSSNMQLWEFYRVRSSDAKAKLSEYCFDQAAARTANELVVFVARPDKYKQSIKFNLDTITHSDNFEKDSSKALRTKYYSKIMPLFYMRDYTGMAGLLKKLFVFVVGLYRPMVREVSAVNKKVTIHKSIALAAQTFMLAVKSHDYDTCPMEGFDSKRIKKLLNLPCSAEINMVISVGKGTPEGIFYPRKRFDYKDVVTEL